MVYKLRHQSVKPNSYFLRIISRAVSFKSVENKNSALQADVVIYKPISSRIEFVADLAANWVKLRYKSPEKRRIALIL
ncbi:MAG: cobaltochelatase subunit CobN, partial [Cyanobacteria bacterium J06636_27]